MPKTQLTPNDLAVVVNLQDDLSIRIGRYYMEQRKIPAENLVEVSFTAREPAISATQFRRLYRQVSDKLPAHIQAFALAWALPYKAGCMSITSAFATGYDTRYCPKSTCSPTHPSPYFNSHSHAPHIDHGIRPAMLLAATTFDKAKALIDRGILADGSFPTGTAYLLSTSDKNRNVRSQGYGEIVNILGKALRIEVIQSDILRDRDDVLFYFTGLTKVEAIGSNQYLPGAVADHLTSAGGNLESTGQMSSLRWLEAGATGSFGTVVEPCNFQQKFPVPGLVMQGYLSGETLIESYWKSVAWPGEGVFIGEPLAAPFSGHHVEHSDDGFKLRTQSLFPGRYLIMGSPSAIGPFTPIGEIIPSGPGMQTFSIPNRGYPYVSLHRQ